MSVFDFVIPVGARDTKRQIPGWAGYRRTGKRIFDYVFAIALLPLIAPVIAVLSLAIARDGGNPFFGHRRIWREGNEYRKWKQRTMVVEAEARLQAHLRDNPEAAAEWEMCHKLTNDPRITRLGCFLRRTSLDELPQIWNVLRNEMSFVGPRPVVRSELHRYGPHRVTYKSMMPGITGLWQVSGRNDICYADRVDFDLAYSKSMSFLTDAMLIARTGLSVIARTGK